MAKTEKPVAGDRDGLSDDVRLAVEHPKDSPSRRSQQEIARASEIVSRRHHLVGRRCGGAMARTELALAQHYGRLARLQMTGGAQ